MEQDTARLLLTHGEGGGQIFGKSTPMSGAATLREKSHNQKSNEEIKIRVWFNVVKGSEKSDLLNLRENQKINLYQKSKRRDYGKRRKETGSGQTEKVSHAENA